MSEIKKKKKKSLGAKVVEWLPSQHPDRDKASEQERGLQEAIDFIVPQSKTDLALSLIPFVGMQGKPVVKKAFREGIKHYKKWSDTPNRRFAEIDAWKRGEWKPSKSLKEGREWIKDWFSAYRGEAVEKSKSAMELRELESVKINVSKTLPDNAYGRFQTFGPTVKRKADDSYEIIEESAEVQMNKNLMDYDVLEAKGDISNLSVKDWVKSLGVHEYLHAIHRSDNQALGKPVLNLIDNALTKSQLEEGARVLPGWYNWDISAKDIRRLTGENYYYLKEPTEIYARIMEMRFQLGQDPVRLTKAYHKLSERLFRSNRPYNELRKVLSHKQIEKLYNNLPAIAPFSVAPLAKGKDDKNRKY